MSKKNDKSSKFTLDSIFTDLDNSLPADSTVNDVAELPLGSNESYIIDLGLSTLVNDLSTNQNSNIFVDKFERRFQIFNSILKEEVESKIRFESLKKAVEKSFSEYGEDDLLGRFFWLYNSLHSEDLSIALLASALLNFLNDLNKNLKENKEFLQFINENKIGLSFRDVLSTLIFDILKHLEEAPLISEKITTSYEDFKSNFNNDLFEVEIETSKIEENKTSKSFVDVAYAKISTSYIYALCLLLLILAPYFLLTAIFKSPKDKSYFDSATIWNPAQYEKNWNLEASNFTLIVPNVSRAKIRAVDLIDSVADTTVEKFDSAMSKYIADTTNSVERFLQSSNKEKNSQALKNNSVKSEKVISNTLNSSLNLKSPLESKDVFDSVTGVSDIKNEVVVGSDLDGVSFPTQKNFVTGRVDESETPSDSKFYTVQNSTAIFIAPSATAQRIGNLSMGDKILVEKEFDGWFQVRSKQGRVGYILSNDVDRR